MALAPGTRLGHYEIESAIGAGGMGEVYKAHDPRLGRHVALKTLPASFASDPERLRRFELEARATAALNHPNILVVFDVGTHDGTPYVVSELLEGETLRHRLSAQLSTKKAVEFAIQSARGLAAAHEKGIIHRDLKPENLFVTDEGHVKILDFGLAKLASRDAEAAAATTTMAQSGTEPGMVMGTAGYMAPEQVRGRQVDARTDIFAFGAVLYEMLSGQRAFKGDSVAETMAAIVKENPPELPVVERHIPSSLARIVDRCLEKAPAARFQTASDLAFALEALSGSSDRTEISRSADDGRPEGRPLHAVTGSRALLPWAAAAVFGVGFVATGLVAVNHWRESAGSASIVSVPVTRFAVAPPSGTLSPTTPPVVSPDGQKIVFGIVVDGVTTLRLRSTNGVDISTLAGTEGAINPFWSPDSQNVAFSSGGRLRRVSVAAGSQPVIICDVSAGSGGSWGSDNTIVFGPGNGPLSTVPASGGTPRAVTTLDNEAAHRWPSFLPDGRRFLYVSVENVVAGAGKLWLASLDSRDRYELGAVNSDGQYAADHLFYLRNGALVAQPFDANAGRTTGDPVVVAQPVEPLTSTVRGWFSASSSGVLTYRLGTGGVPTSLTWFDRAGKTLGTVGALSQHLNLAISADDRRLAASELRGSPFSMDLWAYDLTGNSGATRLTTDRGAEFDPSWSPNGTDIAFTSTRQGSFDLFRRLANSNDPDTLVLKVPAGASGTDWSPDGAQIAYASGNDVWLVSTSGSGVPVKFIESPVAENQPAISPDGRWMAYTSTESGRQEIHVQSFPTPTGKHVVSKNGGRDARWRGDSRELFYLSADNSMMAASLDTTGAFEVTREQRLFPTLIQPTTGHSFVVTRNGQRFLIPVADQAASAAVNQFVVLVNWKEAIK